VPLPAGPSADTWCSNTKSLPTLLLLLPPTLLLLPPSTLLLLPPTLLLLPPTLLLLPPPTLLLLSFSARVIIDELKKLPSSPGGSTCILAAGTPVTKNPAIAQ
jgi:hypothetical protein